MARYSQQTLLGTGAETAESEAGKETVIAEVNGVSTEPAFQQVILDVVANVTTETEGEEVILRVRRESVTGHEVGKCKVALGASAKSVISAQFRDMPGEVAGMKYVLTAEEKKNTKKVVAHFPTLQAIF